VVHNHDYRIVQPATVAKKYSIMKIYGIYATLRNLDVTGDIVYEDSDGDMTVYLEFAFLKGAIQNANIILDESSR
jgi:hypothetical protein